MSKINWILLLSFVMGCGEAAAAQFRVERLNDALPIISREHFKRLGVENEGLNINGPSVIRIPQWIPKDKRASPEARYYMYFAHHRGLYIRLAWAENVEGPWELYQSGENIPDGERGVLDLGSDGELTLDTGLTLARHIASPDVHVDNENKRIVMYFHAPIAYEQKRKGKTKEFIQVTFFAESPLGLDFSEGILPVPISQAYLRVFEHEGVLQGLTAKEHCTPQNPEAPWATPGGPIFSGESLWHCRKNKFLEFSSVSAKQGDDSFPEKSRVRHVAMHQQGNVLNVFFTMKRHSPERVYVTSVDMSEDCWFCAKPETLPMEVLRPEELWEGSALTPTPSKGGPEMNLVNALRDPFVFEDGDSLYLFYVGGGEQAIGVGRLSMPVQ